MPDSTGDCAAASIACLDRRLLTRGACALAQIIGLAPLVLRGAPLPDAADRLLAAMTLADKIAMVHGATESASSYQGQAGYLPGVPRLGIPSLRLVSTTTSARR